MKRRFFRYNLVSLFIFFGCAAQGQEQLLRKMIKSKPEKAASIQARPQLPKAIAVPAAGGTPIVSGVNPQFGGKGSVITITGNNFDNTVKVTFGGIPINKVSVVSTNSIQVQLDGEVQDGIIATTAAGASPILNGFTYVKEPAISELDKKKFETGDKITIEGENFINDVKVWIDGVPQTVTINSDTEIEMIVAGPAAKGFIELETPGGKTSYGSAAPFDAAANITVPLQGQGINIIPTPTFNFTQVHNGGNFGFRLGVWGNTLGTDSSLKKTVNNLLVPQISLFGFKADGLLRLTNLSAKCDVAVAAQLNVLLKKVSYYDTISKEVSSVNPFALHPKLGVTANFFNNYVFIGGYLNMLSIVTENEEFETFFGSKKSTFFYPNFNFGGIFDLEGGNQSLKVELDLVIHNGETRMLFSSKDKMIPYLRIALISDL